MLSNKKELVSELGHILPCYYELYCDTTTKLPCITYIEYENYDDKTGDTFGYSYIGYTIKIWADDIKDIDGYAYEVDKCMRKLGYNRTNCYELTVDNQIEKVINYEAFGLERY